MSLYSDHQVHISFKKFWRYTLLLHNSDNISVFRNMGIRFSKPRHAQQDNEPEMVLSIPEQYLAKPSGPCCLKGTIHKGEARGRWETIAGVETYISTPPEGKANGNILLYFPDVWGMFPNGFLVMDAFADEGYLVLGLDYFCGDPVWKHRKNWHDDTTDPDFDYEAWKHKHTAFADEATPRWVAAVKQRQFNEDVKYFCVGYCFGAPYVCKSLADGTAIAGAFAHPAFLKESHFQKVTSESRS